MNRRNFLKFSVGVPAATVLPALPVLSKTPTKIICTAEQLPAAKKLVGSSFKSRWPGIENWYKEHYENLRW